MTGMGFGLPARYRLAHFALLPACLGFSAMPSHAQALYKCGSTYSQTPCAPDAATPRLFKDASPTAGTQPTGYALCAATAPAAAAVLEPETARIRPLGQRVTEVIQYAGQSIPAHRFDLTIDSKNPYGVFTGPIPYSCWLSEDQARLLQFGPRPAR
jgi:hypothetical protein